MSTKPNVLLLLCDQMQHQRIGFLDPIAHTPFLNDLAAEGIHFKNAYTCHGQCVQARAARCPPAPGQQGPPGREGNMGLQVSRLCCKPSTPISQP